MRLVAILTAFVCVTATILSVASAAERSARVATYDRAVNETLDTLIWVHAQLAREKNKITWTELNARVCAEMNVRRTEPWQRR